MTTRLNQMNALLSREAAKNNQPAIEKLSKHIGLRNNRYYLNITKADCQKMGISPLEYQKVVLDLEKTNRFLAQVESGSGQKALANTENSLLNGKSSGKIIATGQEHRSDGGWAKTGMTHVRFKCWGSSAPKAVFTCKTSVQGGEIRFKVATRHLNGGPTIVDVPIVTSNCAVEVTFFTTDSNGGSADWEFIKL